MSDCIQCDIGWEHAIPHSAQQTEFRSSASCDQSYLVSVQWELCFCFHFLAERKLLYYKQGAN